MYCKTRKNMTLKFHENALRQFSRRLKFTNLASLNHKKILTYLFMLPECTVKPEKKMIKFHENAHKQFSR